MRETRLGRRPVQYPSVTHAGYFKGFISSFSGAKTGEAGEVASWDFGQLDILCGSGKEKVTAA